MSTGQLFIGLLFLAIGLSSLTNIDIFHYVWPVIFIFIGIRILIGRRIYRRRTHGFRNIQENSLNEVSVFSGTGKRIESDAFTGGKMVAIFSGTEVDLTHVKMKGKTAELQLVAIYGGIKVVVPKGWRVISEGVGVLGGFSNNTTGHSETSPTLTMTGAAIFGGVEIVN